VEVECSLDIEFDGQGQLTARTRAHTFIWCAQRALHATDFDSDIST